MSILIVDDNATNLTLLRMLAAQVSDLDVHGFEVSPQALDWCAHNTPTLIIVDYMMPDLDGVSFTEKVRAMPDLANVPVVMVTADADRNLRQRALVAGATDFLTKPVDTIEFKLRIKNLLDLSQARRALEDHARWLTAEVDGATQTILEREQELIERLARAAEYRDPTTGSHITRMARYSRLIAHGLKFDNGFCDAIMAAAPMHDIGKLATPDQILLKAGALDGAELDVMRNHTVVGAQILGGSTAPLIELASVIARSHHERFDGKGYPDGLRGEDIPIAGRIVAVADVFDALTTQRPYKKAWTLERSRQYIEDNAGLHFCPRCVNALVSQWDQVLAIRAQYPDPTAASPAAC